MLMNLCLRFNRYIVECKSNMDDWEKALGSDLIDT